MGPQPHPNPLVAVDSNVPLDLADGNESVLDALNTIRGRLTNARFVVTPSVFQELAHVALHDSSAARRALGRTALWRLKQWQFDLLEIVPVGHGIVESIARRLQDLQEHGNYHAAAIQKVIAEQMDATVAQQMNAGGGGRAILDAALKLLTRVCPT